MTETQTSGKECVQCGRVDGHKLGCGERTDGQIKLPVYIVPATTRDAPEETDAT